MTTRNNQAKTLFPLSLDGRGVRGEGVLRYAKIALVALLLATSNFALADDECGTQIDSGNPETFSCSDPDYNSGVTYTTDGDLTLNFDNAAGNPANSPARSNIGGVGISVTGVGSDAVTIDSASTATELDSAGATGALVGVTTVDGNIVIGVEELDADFVPTTHGIFAESTGSGSIFIDTTGVLDVQSGTNPDTSIGIEALTGTGAIDITTGGNISANAGGIRAVSDSGAITIETNDNIGAASADLQYGILAATGGTDVLSITAADVIHVGNNSDGTAIDASTMGDIVIDIVSTGSLDGINSGSGVGIRADAGGDVLINVGDGRSVNADIGMDLTAAGDITVNNTGSISGDNNAGEFAIRAVGSSITLTNNDGPSNFDGIQGALDFSQVTGGYTFNNNGLWNISVGAFTGGNPQSISTLGAGTFNNADRIAFGTRESVILASGTTFNGLSGSELTMGITLSSVGQDNCANPTVAGCFDLSGGSTTGQTQILIATIPPPLDPAGGLTTAANPGILLVDVGGGTSAAEHFVLDPGAVHKLDTDGNGSFETEIPIYAESSIYGGVLATGGPLVYALLYDSEAQQHWLSSVPTDEGVTYAAFNQEVLSMWHTTADAVVARQADLREGAARGGWVRVVSDSSERDSAPVLTTHGNTFTYDQDYDLDTTAVMFGVDVNSGENHIIGLHTGLVRSHLEFDNSSNRDRTKGAAVGVYGSWWSDLGPGQLTLDGALNGNFLRLKHWNSIEVTTSDVRTVGLRAEAGWLFPINEMFYVQPLVSAAYARANIETLELRQNNISFEDVDSQRVGGGLRLGGDMDLSGNRFRHLRYWLTARAWEENAEDGSVDFQTTGEPLSIEDDISESVEEVSLGVSLTSPDKDLNVFLSGGVQSGDQTDGTNVTIGARMNW